MAVRPANERHHLHTVQWAKKGLTGVIHVVHPHNDGAARSESGDAARPRPSQLLNWTINLERKQPRRTIPAINKLNCVLEALALGPWKWWKRNIKQVCLISLINN